VKQVCFIILSLVLAASALLACSQSPSTTTPAATQSVTPLVTTVSAPVTIRYAHQSMGVQREVFVAKEKGYFEANGINVELVKLQSANMPSALAGGSIDAGGTSPIFALPAIVQGARMKAVLSSVEYNLPNSLPWICVLKDSPVQKPEDLDGKSISGWERGSNLWLGVQEDYEEYHIKFSQYVGAPTGQFQPMLLAGAVEAGILYPDNYLIQYKDQIRTIIPMKSIAKFGSSATHWFSTDFIEKHPESVRAFLKSLQQARELEKTNLTEVAEINLKYAGKKVEDFLLGFDNQSQQLYPDEPLLEVWQLKNEHDAMVKYGLLKNAMDAKLWIDERFARPVYEMPSGALDFLSNITSGK
jgi:NitT/TauT family transport system substrate-binding protein